jgi:hypothetical protein
MKKILMAIAGVGFLASCSNNDPAVSRIQAQADSIRIAENAVRTMRDKMRLDSFERAEAREIALVQEQQRLAAVRSQRVAYASAAPRRTYVKGYTETVYNTQSQAQQRKKGWSSAAKGAAIGAGAGILTGILVDKKDARGAVIGGVLGAGTGYVIGRAQDRKSGRVQ